MLMMLLVGCVLSSCKSTEYLSVSGVAYQSIRGVKTVNYESVPSDATIIVYSSVDQNGIIEVTVKNNTDKIMTIDRTRSFFRDGNDNSVPYYDPVVAINTQSTMVGSTTGASVNLGSVAKAAGIGGAIGTALSGMNVGGANSTATTNTETTYFIDQPQIHIAPHGSASMGRQFNVTGFGWEFLGEAINSTIQDVNNIFTPEHTYASCNICISYSLDDGASFETLIIDLYANTLLVSKVRQTGLVNEALRRIYISKRDALTEQWYLIHFKSKEGNDSHIHNNSFINYK